MDIKIPLGIENKKEIIVKEEDTAIKHKSGEVNVLSTPRLLALMEEVSYESVKEFLPLGYVSVGIEMHIYHLKASAIGQKITCESCFTKQEGKRLFFSVTVSDDTSKIGEGTVIRYIVEKNHFEEKAKNKLEEK